MVKSTKPGEDITDISDFTIALKKLSRASKLSVGIRHDAMFLGAWLIGVNETGIEYFCAPINTRLEKVKSIDSLRPNLKKIKRKFSDMEEQKAALLLTMCDFYSPGFSAPFLGQLNIISPATLALKLDPVGKQVASILLENYAGWKKPGGVRPVH